MGGVVVVLLHFDSKANFNSCNNGVDWSARAFALSSNVPHRQPTDSEEEEGVVWEGQAKREARRSKERVPEIEDRVPEK